MPFVIKYEKSTMFDNLLAGEAISAGDPVYIRDSDGRVMRALNTGAGTTACGFALRDAANNAFVTVVQRGVFGGYSSLTPGGRVWLGSSAGAITQTAPTTAGQVRQPLGHAINATTVIFNLVPGFVAVQAAGSSNANLV